MSSAASSAPPVRLAQRSIHKGVTQRALRWPLLLAVVLILTLELLAYAVIRSFVLLYEFASRNLSTRHADIRRRLREARSFTDWCKAARELDKAEGRDGWKRDPAWPYYDPELLTSHLQSLRSSRAAGEMKAMMRNLKTIFSLYNFGGMDNYQLYNQTNFGTKVLVQDFIQEVLECTILCRDSAVVPLQTRREWFRRVRKAYGRTALLLSGGAGMGYYHIGVVKALWEAKCLPSIISGASAGSLMCGFLAVRSDEEISQLFSPDCHTLFRACADPWSVKLQRWLSRGYLFDVNDWMVKLRRDFTKGDVTFAEAFAMTRRTINITITSVSKYVPSIILNHKSTPDVLIWSAILASSAMPNIIQPVELLAKDREGRIRPFHVHGKTWTDGTIKNDIPVKEIAAMHNANFFVVSQVNPHLIPFFYSSRGSTGRPTLYSPGSGYRGGFILSTLEKLLKLDMKKWLQLLSELDLLPVVFGTDWRYIFLQPVSGTVTVVPSAPVSAYFRMITDPTYETLRDYIHIGESCTWPRLARISNHFRLERLLNDCKRALDAQAERQAQTGDEQKRRLLQREVREIMKEQKQKERWSSEGEGEDDADAADRSRAARGREGEEAAGGAAGQAAEDESIVVEPVGEIDTAHPMRRASAGLQSRKIERELKARVIREHREQMGTADSGRRGSSTAEADSAQPFGLSSPRSARSEPPPVDAAPPIVFDAEGQAYLTDTAETDDEFDEDSLPASPLKNM